MKYLRFDYIRKDVSFFVYFVHGHRIGGGGGEVVRSFLFVDKFHIYVSYLKC